MAPSKKTTNTSKTAHVMNLLSKSRPSASEDAQAGDLPEQGLPEASSLPPIMTSLQPDIEAAEQIRSALEDALSEELGGDPVLKEPAAGEATAEEPAAAEPAEAEPAAEEPAADAGGPPIEYVNVMQVLVEEKTRKYMDMFGLCTCPRCTVDVEALALNNLQPKYVVMNRGEAVPRLSVYEGRYSAEITMQILRACQTVMGSPRH